MVQQNQEIQGKIVELTSLYEQKVESIYRERQATKDSGFGLEFWVGLVGLVGSISGLILAWRKDRRELIELSLKEKSVEHGAEQP